MLVPAIVVLVVAVDEQRSSSADSLDVLGQRDRSITSAWRRVLEEDDRRVIDARCVIHKDKVSAVDDRNDE